MNLLLWETWLHTLASVLTIWADWLASDLVTAQSLEITVQGEKGTTVIQIQFVCVASSFFGGVWRRERGFISKETVIIFHVTLNMWGLSGWLMAESVLRWNQEKVFVYWCQSLSDGTWRWRIVGSGSDYPLHWHSLIPRPTFYFGNG